MDVIDLSGEHDRKQVAVFDDQCRTREGELLLPEKPEQNLSQIEVKVPAALRGVDLGTLATRSDVVRALTAGLPLNEYQLPKFIYRADLIDPTLFCGANSPDTEVVADRYLQMQEALESARLDLMYHEGYPALPDGSPVWDILPFESQTDLTTFIEYLQLPGARKLSLLSSSSQGISLRDPTTKSFPDEARGSSLVELFHSNYWAFRAHAHDLFAIAHARRIQEQRVIKTQDKHFLESEKLLQRLYAMFPTIDLDSLTNEPEKLVKIMDQLIKIQRVSLGLSAIGGAPREDTLPSVSVTIRKMVSQDKNVIEDATEQDAMSGAEELLRDPAALTQMQELVLKYGGDRGNT